MEASRFIINKIKNFEGFRPNGKLEKVSNVWAIGYGFRTMPDWSKINSNSTITIAEADAFIEKILLKRYAKAVSNQLSVKLTQSQFDAVLSLAYNVGPYGFPSLIKAINSNPNNPAIKSIFLRYNKSNGVVLAGLVNRREFEANLYFSGVADMRAFYLLFAVALVIFIKKNKE